GRTLVDQPSFEWRADPVGDPGAPGSGVLLPEPGAGTRPRVFSNETVKDVPGRFVNHVMGLDTSFGLSGAVRRPDKVCLPLARAFLPSTRTQSPLVLRSGSRIDESCSIPNLPDVRITRA